MTAGLRMVAIAIAAATLLDPAIAIRRSQPLPVDVRAIASPSDPVGTEAARVKQQLTERLRGTVTMTRDNPRAVVLIGGWPAGGDLPEGVPVSTVSLEPRGPNVRIAGVRAISTVVPGQRAIVAVTLEVRDAPEPTSTIVLERDGLELARTSYTWRAGEQHGMVTLSFAPIEAGPAPVRVRVLPAGRDVSTEDNVADVTLGVVNRPLEILVWEPRPSWTAAFVHRALEAAPDFEVASLAQSSRGLDTRAGAPPAALAAGALARFDVVIVGAPEELDRAAVSALDSFARERGGAVVLLPDRAPTGEYTRLLPSGRFDEVLLEHPVRLLGSDGPAFQASEFALPRGDISTATAVASLARPGGGRPALLSWPRGDGIVVFSGALDGWRFRGADEGGFATFWTAFVASLASQSPPPLSVAVEPAMAGPGDPVTIRARYRATEVRQDGPTTAVPPVSTTVIDAGGHATSVRLWPLPVAGEYEGTIEAPRAGRYDVRVIGGGGLAADAPLVVAADARTRRLASVPAWLAEATGGIAVHATDMSGIEAFLRAAPRPSEPTTVHAMRSGWWIVPFAGALCAEWALRRRKGLP